MGKPFLQLFPAGALVALVLSSCCQEEAVACDETPVGFQFVGFRADALIEVIIESDTAGQGFLAPLDTVTLQSEPLDARGDTLSFSRGLNFLTADKDYRVTIPAARWTYALTHLSAAGTDTQQVRVCNDFDEYCYTRVQTYQVNGKAGNVEHGVDGFGVIAIVR